MPHLGEGERLGVSDHGGVEQLFFRVESAELKIIRGEFGVNSKPRIPQIGQRGFGFTRAGFHAIADATPEVQFP